MWASWRINCRPCKLITDLEQRVQALEEDDELVRKQDLETRLDEVREEHDNLQNSTAEQFLDVVEQGEHVDADLAVFDDRILALELESEASRSQRYSHLRAGASRR